MNDDDSRSNDAPGPSRPDKNKRRSDDKDSAIEVDTLDIKRTAAKRRWAILSEHLTKKVRSSSDGGNNGSGNNAITSTFNTYGLHELEQIGQDETGTWYKLRWKDKEWPALELRLIDKFRFDVMDLSGFNNTGNIRIWPAEECLAYYLLENPQLYQGKSVLEIGGGMTGLAGICCGFYASEVFITDGNESSIENLETIIRHNNLEEKCNAVFHRWNESFPEPLTTKQFDLVIAADCYFDPDVHEPFIDTLVSSLSPTGIALLFAPERGGSLRSFIEKLFQRNIFNVEQTANICDGITSKISAITASSSIEDFDADKDHVLDQKLIYHSYLTAQVLKENEKYGEIEFNADALVRISGIVKAVFLQKWLPELNSLANIKNRGVEDVDIELLFRNNPLFMQNVLKCVKEFEGEEEEEEEENGEEEEAEVEDFEKLLLKNSPPQTPVSSKTIKQESLPNLTINNLDESKIQESTSEKPTVSTSAAIQSETSESPVIASTFASSKRQATDSINDEIPAKISKFDLSLTESQAINMIYSLGPKTPEISRTNTISTRSIPSIPQAPKPYVPPAVIKPVTPRQHIAAKTNVSNPAPKSNISKPPPVIPQKQHPPALPPKQQLNYDSFEDDDDFLEVLEVKQTVTPKPPVIPVKRRDSFYDDEEDEMVAQLNNIKPEPLKRRDSFYDDEEDEILAQLIKSKATTPLQNTSNIPKASPRKRPKGGFTFEDDDED